MVLIDSKGWSVDYNSDTELYLVIDPMGNQCITPKIRIINPDHFIISHTYFEENIFPSMSIPCLAKYFNPQDQKKLYKVMDKRPKAYRLRPKLKRRND